MIVSHAYIFLHSLLLACVAHADSITHAEVLPPHADIFVREDLWGPGPQLKNLQLVNGEIKGAR